jgi:hypothetical protein
VRITPAKWDAEYTWLREGQVRSIGTSPLVTVPNDLGNRGRQGSAEVTNTEDGIGLKATHRNSSILGMTMQAIGAFMLLAILGLDGILLPLLSLAVVLSGEIIFISSITHGGNRNRSEMIR